MKRMKTKLCKLSFFVFASHLHAPSYRTLMLDIGHLKFCVRFIIVNHIISLVHVNVCYMFNAFVVRSLLTMHECRRGGRCGGRDDNISHRCHVSLAVARVKRRASKYIFILFYFSLFCRRFLFCPFRCCTFHLFKNAFFIRLHCSVASDASAQVAEA